MFALYLKPVLPRILGNKLFSSISIISLAIGMTSAILILGFISYERGFDGMHHGSENIYRLNWGVEETNSRFATFYNPVAPILADALPEIESYTRLAFRRHVVSANDVNQFLTVSLVDNDFFSFFNYPPLQRNPDAAIRDSGSVVLTRAASEQLFGTSATVGRVLTLDDAFDFQVSAVVENNPANSHLGANVFINIENLPRLWEAPDFWTRAGYTGSDLLYAYVKLASGTDAGQMEAKIGRYINDNLVPEYDQQVYLQPLREIHFTQDLQNELPMVDDILGTVKPRRGKTDMILFGTIAVLTLAIASLNFMNMQAVQFTKRIREIGVRRIAGSSRFALSAQLLAETAMMALFALAVSIPLYELLAPYFNDMLGLPPGQGFGLTFPVIAALIPAALLLGVLVGLYPASSASRLAPGPALRGELSKGRTPMAVRSVLIVLQFTISIGLIIGSVTVRNQIEYALSKSLGFDPRGVVRVEFPTDEAARAYPVIRNALLSLPGIASVSAGTTIPTRGLSNGAGYVPEGGTPENMLLTRTVSVRDGYFDTLGMAMVAGRSFSEDFPSDQRPVLSPDNRTGAAGVILNETAARQAGWHNPEDAVGKRLIQSFLVRGEEWRLDYTVVGIVADAHFTSIRQQVEPVSFVYPQVYDPNVMAIRLSGIDQAGTLAAIDRLWQDNVPELPIQRSFLTEDYAAMYTAEERTFTLFIALSSLAVLIACSGLYGLAAYITDRRTKEIGIRKVLGSGVWRIVLLLSNDFSRLVLLSNLVAWPVAYVAMNRWLENFAYRIDLTPLVFIGSGLIALCIAWVTVGSTAAKAASRKPVLALRYE